MFVFSPSSQLGPKPALLMSLGVGTREKLVIGLQPGTSSLLPSAELAPTVDAVGSCLSPLPFLDTQLSRNRPPLASRRISSVDLLFRLSPTEPPRKYLVPLPSLPREIWALPRSNSFQPPSPICHQPGMPLSWQEGDGIEFIKND